MARFKFVVDGNYVNFLDGLNTVCRLHNSSRCVEWRYDDTTGIKFRVDNFEYQTAVMGDIEIDGDACSEQSDFGTAIVEIFPGLSSGDGEGGGLESIVPGDGIEVDDTDPANPVVSLPYKCYVALLEQSGENAPVATVLQNTIGNIVWTRENTGFYLATLSESFPVDKSVIFVQNSGNAIVSAANQETGTPSSSMYVNTYVNDTPEDGILYLNSVEIRIYP